MGQRKKQFHSLPGNLRQEIFIPNLILLMIILHCPLLSSLLSAHLCNSFRCISGFCLCLVTSFCSFPSLIEPRAPCRFLRSVVHNPVFSYNFTKYFQSFPIRPLAFLHFLHRSSQEQHDGDEVPTAIPAETCTAHLLFFIPSFF